MRFAGLLLAALLLTTPASAQEGWEGELQTSGWPVFIAVHLPAGGTRGTLAIPGVRIPIAEVKQSGETLRVVAGDDANAITVEGTIAGDRWTGTFTQGKSRLPFTLSRIPAYPKPKDRLEGWGQDLDALVQRFLKYDRSFSPGERLRFIEDVEALRKELPKLDDPQVIMRMASAVALARNAHTRLYLVRNRTEVRRLPVRLWWFADGLYVVRATPEYRKLLGCRVDDFNGVPSRNARDLVSQAFAGNSSWKDYKSVYFLTSPEALHGFGITPDTASVDVGVSVCGATPFRAKIEPLPLLRKSKPTEAWWDLSPLSKDADREWVHVLDGRKQLPLYLRDPNHYYWYEYLPESGLLYVHYNRASEHPDETTKAFGERLLGELAKQPVKGLVVDLRFNTGGDYGLAKALMEQLAEQTKDIPRWVITGRNTFSAGITHVVLWKARPGVKLVGEPAGDELDLWSEGGNIILPSSGLYAHFANGLHSYSEGGCPENTYCYDLSVPTIQPDIPATATWSDYLKGRDPMFEAIVHPRK